jgi:hypothetical protein
MIGNMPFNYTKKSKHVFIDESNFEKTIKMFVEELFTSECSDYIIELNHCSQGQ